ncbi:MAG: general secretion pathway protein GspB [Gammaproteobacteria bacterium]|nr:general secretion pathway protein GspB [Gammaproteobacteria bacterium]
MSMILDALSRAEKERQSENAVGIDTARYATSSTIKEDRFKKWVLIALAANFALIIFLSIGYIWKTYLHKEPSKISLQNKEEASEPVVNNQEELVVVIDEPSQLLAPQSIELSNDANKTLPASSLLDEAKVTKSEVVKKSSKKTIKKIVKKTPPVQYSSKPLSAPIELSKPTVASVTAAVEKQNTTTSNTDYVKLTDIPVSQRAQLSQYEVNVHVYDDSGKSSFVLINMVKYRQGDKLPGGQSYISAIVPEGVVVNYGSGKVLLERNQ